MSHVKKKKSFHYSQRLASSSHVWLHEIETWENNASLSIVRDAK